MCIGFAFFWIFSYLLFQNSRLVLLLLLLLFFKKLLFFRVSVRFFKSFLGSLEVRLRHFTKPKFIDSNKIQEEYQAYP